MTSPDAESRGPVSRVEILDHLADAFATSGGGLTKDDLVVTAVAGGAPVGVVAALRRLPAGQYHHPHEFWRHLPEVPIER